MNHQLESIPFSYASTAFEISEHLAAESFAFDLTQIGDWTTIIQVRYIFALNGYKDCARYLGRSPLAWNPRPFHPAYFPTKDMLDLAHTKGPHNV